MQPLVHGTRADLFEPIELEGLRERFDDRGVSLALGGFDEMIDETGRSQAGPQTEVEELRGSALAGVGCEPR